MRKLQRKPLPGEVEDYLADRTGKVHAAADEPKKAANLWKSKRKAEFRVVRDTLKHMATGVERCMYCEDSHGTDIEHFWPKSQYPRKAFSWENYLLACSECNSNYKRTLFPLDNNGDPLLIDPTDQHDDPRNHIGFSPSTGKFVAHTPKGRHSIEVFGIDRYALEIARKNAWGEYQELLAAYASHQEAGRHDRATRIKDIICNISHTSVLLEILEVAGTNKATSYLQADCLAAINNHPEIANWLV